MSNLILEKEVGEVVPATLDFVKNIPDGEAISGTPTVIIVDRETGTDVTTTMLEGTPGVYGTIVAFIVKAGVNLAAYIATVEIITAPTGYKLYGHLIIIIKNFSTS